MRRRNDSLYNSNFKLKVENCFLHIINFNVSISRRVRVVNHKRSVRTFPHIVLKVPV